MPVRICAACRANCNGIVQAVAQPHQAWIKEVGFLISIRSASTSLEFLRHECLHAPHKPSGADN